MYHIDCAGLEVEPEEEEWACPKCMYEAEALYFGIDVEVILDGDGREHVVEAGDASRHSPIIYVSRHMRVHNRSNRLELAFELTSLPSYNVEVHWAREVPDLDVVRVAAVARYEEFQLERYGPRWAEAFPGGL